MAGEQAHHCPAMPSFPVTWSLAPSIINYRTNAIYEIGRPLRAEGAARATWTRSALWVVGQAVW